MNNSVLIGLGIVIGIYLLFKLFFGKNEITNEYEQTYNKILTSKEYKVKGQYEK
tara:strand:+ start:5946 stop:6107 length:162 start_codon:yes stop_codon:yes gene_type:complete